MQKPVVSIIIPVYNSEKYICQCLQSIVMQTYTDWECILVDDGSTDSSGSICDEYKENDSRFKVIHKGNGGVSSARNVGIKMANGKWLFFMDSDDYLFSDSLYYLVNQGNSNDVGLVQGGFIRYDINGNVIEKCDEIIELVMDNEEAVCQTYGSKYFKYQGYLWNKLFLNEQIHLFNISFNESIYYDEDSLFVIQYLVRTRCNILFSTRPVYNYILRPSGAMSSINKVFNNKILTTLDSYIEKYNEISNSGIYSKDVVVLAKYRCFATYRYLTGFMKQYNISNRFYKTELENKLLKVITKIEYCIYFFLQHIRSIKNKLQIYKSRK